MLWLFYQIFYLALDTGQFAYHWFHFICTLLRFIHKIQIIRKQAWMYFADKLIGSLKLISFIFLNILRRLHKIRNMRNIFLYIFLIFRYCSRTQLLFGCWSDILSLWTSLLIHDLYWNCWELDSPDIVDCIEYQMGLFKWGARFLTSVPAWVIWAGRTHGRILDFLVLLDHMCPHPNIKN